MKFTDLEYASEAAGDGMEYAGFPARLRVVDTGEPGVSSHDLAQAGSARQRAGMDKELKLQPGSGLIQESIDAGQGSFEGLLATFGEPHPTSSKDLPSDWLDVIDRGAFTETLADHAAQGTMPLLLWMHVRGEVCGRWRELWEGAEGLYCRGEVYESARTPNSVFVRELLSTGGITGLSIGGYVLESELDEVNKIRRIKSVVLQEGSIVDVPALPHARVSDTKRRRPTSDDAPRSAALAQAVPASTEAPQVKLARIHRRLQEIADEQLKDSFRALEDVLDRSGLMA